MEKFLLGSWAGPDSHQLSALDDETVRASLKDVFFGGDFQVIDFVETGRIAVLGHFEDGGFFFLDWNGPMTVGDLFAQYPPAWGARLRNARVYREGIRMELDDDFERMHQFELKPRDILILPWRTDLITFFGRPKQSKDGGE